MAGVRISRFRSGRKLAGLLAIFLVLGAALGAWGSSFQFVVIGDTRPKIESENFAEFERLIPAINALQPTFVFNVGDLIYGYGPVSKNKQWDKYERVIRGIQAPYYQLPGNHDTHSKSARRMYGRRFGRFYYSFDSGGWHFVLLDNNEEQCWGFLGSTQIEWLRKDLQQSAGRPTLVFLHFPIWEANRFPVRIHEIWRDTLHPLFLKSNVRAVFGGHFHAYGPTREYDGIRYYTTGGGGAELLPAYRKSGGQHHFLRVNLTDGNCEVRVVTREGELSDLEADVMGGFLFADQHSTRVGINPGTQNLREGVRFSYSLHNPYSEAMTGKATWNLDTKSFAVEPPTISVNVPAGGTGEFAFTVKALQSSATLASLPRLEFDVSAGIRRHRFHRDLHMVQQLTSAYRGSAPVLDGRLTEWESVVPLRLGKASAEAPELRSWHDALYLYFAVVVPAMDSEEQEESAFPDDLQLGLAWMRSETEFAGDFLRLGFLAKSATAFNRLPGALAGTTAPEIKSAARVNRGKNCFEVTIPLHQLKRGHPAARLMLNVSFPGPDGGPDKEDPNVNSFEYRVRYGSGSLVPIYFVELDLGKTRPGSQSK